MVEYAMEMFKLLRMARLGHTPILWPKKDWTPCSDCGEEFPDSEMHEIGAAWSGMEPAVLCPHCYFEGTET